MVIKISVIMPVYNNIKYIDKAIKSVINQSYKDWELIIINDKSTENVSEILDKYNNHPQIKIINNDVNTGCYISLNKGIIASIGEYIARIDSDDYILPNKLKLQSDLLDYNKNIDIVFCNSRTTGGSIIHRCMGAALIRRTVFDKIGYFDSVRIAADTEFKCRFIKVIGSKKTDKIHQILYFITERPNSLSRCNKTGMESMVRRRYKLNYRRWHNSGKKLYISYPLTNRPFSVSKEIL